MRPPNRTQTQLVILSAVLLAIAFESSIYNIEHQLTFYEQPGLAADFSAFYNGAWALTNSPDNVYVGESSYPVPHGQALVYPPHFLIFVLPLLGLSFPNAEFVFSVAQFALLPFIALVIYLLLRPRTGFDYAVTAAVIEIALLEPVDSSHVGIAIWPQVSRYLPLFLLLPLIPYAAYETVSSRYRRVSLLGIAALVVGTLWLAVGPSVDGAPNYLVNSEAYGTQWLLGQSKVLELALVLLALCLADRKPMLSAPVLLLSAFDPRFPLMALPMYLYIIFKNKSLKKMVAGAAVALLLLVLPFALYHGVFQQYASYVLSNYLSLTGRRRYFTFYLFDYDWLVFYGLLALEVGFALLEISRYGALRRRFGDWLSLST